MTNYDDIFEYEDESIRLDFKGAPYPKERHADLLKDIIAFANADYEGDRFIIIGVIKNEKSEKVFRGINKEDIVDSAIYQQLVRENAEPDINLEYFHYSYQGKNFAIFRIFGCSDKPYLMKKDYGNLKQGEGWIRKGTHQPRLIRRDFDSMGEKKQAVQGFSGEVKCYFSDSGSDEIELTPFEEIKFPSDLAAEKIRKIIEEKRNPVEKVSPSEGNSKNTIAELMREFTSPYGKYLTKSIEELENDLENVKKEYADDDKYVLFERYGNFVNISIQNLGDRYIEDASIRVIFPKNEGLDIADKICNPPNRTSIGIANFALIGYGVGYPHVEYFYDMITVQKHLDDIKHQLPIKEVFKEPIRIVVQKNLEGQTILVKCIIHGKNLQKPIEKELKMHVTTKL